MKITPKNNIIQDKENRNISSYNIRQPARLLSGELKIANIASTQMTYYPVHIFSLKIIGEWKNWHAINRKLLVWESSKNRVNRRDTFRYTCIIL
jgi:hypothetical protein